MAEWRASNPKNVRSGVSLVAGLGFEVLTEAGRGFPDNFRDALQDRVFLERKMKRRRSAPRGQSIAAQGTRPGSAKRIASSPERVA